MSDFGWEPCLNKVIQRIVIGCLVAAGILSATGTPCAAAVLRSCVFGSGGGIMTSGGFTLNSTSGQPAVIGPSSSTNFILGAGFWYGRIGVPATPTPSGTPTPTATAVPATATPTATQIPPTSTPTGTPVPATWTPTPVDTPTPPDTFTPADTWTPTPVNTPTPPPDTPTATPTISGGDTCITALTIAMNSQVTGNTCMGYTNTHTPGCTASSTAPDTWYRLILEESCDNVYICLSTDYDSALMLVADNCFTELYCSDDDDCGMGVDCAWGGSNTVDSALGPLSLSPGTYYILVDGFSSYCGNYCLDLWGTCATPTAPPSNTPTPASTATPSPANTATPTAENTPTPILTETPTPTPTETSIPTIPPGDDCATAVSLAMNSQVTGSTCSGFTDQFTPSCPSFSTAPDTWYRLDLVEPCQDVMICLSADYDSAMSIVADDCVTELFCSDDDPCGTSVDCAYGAGNSYDSALGPLTLDTGTYYIVADGWGVNCGSYCLDVWGECGLPTATPTFTPEPSTATPTDTPVPSTATPTVTPVPSTATPTVSPEATETATPPPTGTGTPLPTETPTLTYTPAATETPTPMPGDTCSTALTISMNSQEIGDTCLGYTDQYSPSCPSSSAAPDVWYRLEIPEPCMNISICLSADYDTALSIVADDCSAELFCSDDDPCGAAVDCMWGAGNLLDSAFELAALEPGTYYLVVDGWGSECGNYCLDVWGMCGLPTATPTFTPAPPTVTPTDTPVPPTATATDTPVPPTSTPTDTPVPPTATSTPENTATPRPLPATSPAGTGILLMLLGILLLAGIHTHAKHSDMEKE